MSQSQHSTCALPDGAVLAYEVLGSTSTVATEIQASSSAAAAASSPGSEGENDVPLVLVCGMAHARTDWVRLSTTWAQKRRVLIYDHRGMGDSKHPPDLPPGGDEFTIETLARDLVYLLGHIGWPEVAILGFSMGGVVVQQMLVLPYHPTNPTPLPFRLTHVILACTRSQVLRDPRHGLQIQTPPPDAGPAKPPTIAERYENIRRMIESTVDATWIKANGKHLDMMVNRVISGTPRSLHTIGRQRKALQLFDFVDLLEKIPSDLPVLVIHGDADQVIPFECSKETVQRIPGARFVEIGPEPGKLPTLTFGHNFTLYFPAKVWDDLLEVFLRSPAPVARLGTPSAPTAPDSSGSLALVPLPASRSRSTSPTPLTTPTNPALVSLPANRSKSPSPAIAPALRISASPSPGQAPDVPKLTPER